MMKKYNLKIKNAFIEYVSHQGGRGSWCYSLGGSLKEAQVGVVMTVSFLLRGQCPPIKPVGKDRQTEGRMN